MRKKLLEESKKEEIKEKPKIKRPKIVKGKETIIIEEKPKKKRIKPKKVRKSRKGLKVRRGGPTVRQLMFIAELWQIPNSTNVTSKTKLKNMIINYLE